LEQAASVIEYLSVIGRLANVRTNSRKVRLNVLNKIVEVFFILIVEVDKVHITYGMSYPKINNCPGTDFLFRQLGQRGCGAAPLY
jgi:hypothetical protein